MPIGMTLLGLDARWLMVNKAFCQMVGYSEAEIRALSIWEITYPDDIEADILQRKKAVEGVLENYRWEKRIIHKAGHVVRIEVTCTIVRDASRKPLYFLHHIVEL